MSALISEDQFRKICPKTSPAKVKSVTDAVNKVCPLYGINTSDIFHEFFANLAEETGEFTSYEESLYYSTASRIMTVWPGRFKTLESAAPYVKNAKGLAMKVYGQRKDLGNITALDGWIFRGGGPIQLTGRSNFVNFGNWMAKKFGIFKTPEQWAELLRTNDEYGMHSACWIFAIAFKLIDEAEQDDMRTIVKKINGGMTNYPLRIHYYELCKKNIA